MKKLAVTLFGLLAFVVGNAGTAQASGTAFIKPVEVAYLHDVSQSGTSNGSFGIMSTMYNGSAGQSISIMSDSRIGTSSNLTTFSALVIRPALEDCNKDLKTAILYSPTGAQIFRADANSPTGSSQILQPGVYCEFFAPIPVFSQSSSQSSTYTVSKLSSGTYYLLATYKNGSTRGMPLYVYEIQ